MTTPLALVVQTGAFTTGGGAVFVVVDPDEPEVGALGLGFVVGVPLAAFTSAIFCSAAVTSLYAFSTLGDCEAMLVAAANSLTSVFSSFWRDDIDWFSLAVRDVGSSDGVIFFKISGVIIVKPTINMLKAPAKYTVDGQSLESFNALFLPCENASVIIFLSGTPANESIDEIPIINGGGPQR